jgi:DNA-binding transcriptional ArsR family regulator
VLSSTDQRQQPLFTALADPTRRSLLVHLAQHSPKTATELAQDYPITRQGILKHLDVLEAAQLVVVQQRGRDKRYSLKPEPLAELEGWIAEINAAWDARLLRLKAWIEQDDPAGAGE